MMVSVIQWAFFLCLGSLGFGMFFGSAWLILAGLFLLGLLPALLVASLFTARR